MVLLCGCYPDCKWNLFCDTENASVLFPIISISNIMAVWIIGIVFFKERLRVLQAVGLITGVISVVLLKL